MITGVRQLSGLDIVLALLASTKLVPKSVQDESLVNEDCIPPIIERLSIRLWIQLSSWNLKRKLANSTQNSSPIHLPSYMLFTRAFLS
jgi:hypothetical protein